MKNISYSFILFIVFGCTEKPPEPTKLYNEYRRSVALIQNSYYFKTTLDNGFEFYYTLENDEPVFYDEEQDAISNAGVSYGTGFFISSTGELATNRHVIYPSQETALITKGINDYLNDIKYKLKKLINETRNENSKLADAYNEYYDYLDYDKKVELKDEYANRKNEIIELEQYLENLDFNPNNTTTELKRIFLGIALDDTHVTSENDFIECVAIKKSDVENIDLAIIQIKNKTTPTSATKIFDLEDITLKKELGLNDKVYMIGFNHGISLAHTGNGIKSQFTQGTITQDPDQNKILYSIPTLPGSSGSPVIDEWGNLVAVNFAKTGDFQGFSFGIPSLALTNLYNNKSNANFSNSYPESVPVSTKNDFERKEVDYSERIRDFLKAEEKRDFDAIYGFLSPKFNRYYDITDPSYSKLKNRYEYLWGFTSNSKNYIKSIDKINDYTYDLNTRYTYYNHRKGREFSVNSTVRFLFDENGKIVETYGID